VATKNRDLERYHAKRDFKETPEPKGKVVSRGKTYVVQKHDATRLHYDLRLEHRGVLLSWAVPKEPSLDPTVKRLAVRVEDHPLDYASFEGDIPKGNYGAGHVEIWDRGTWNTSDDIDKALKEGKLTFSISGERLHGEFALVRMGEPSEKENWLLIKHQESDVATPGFMLCQSVERPPAGPEWLHEIKWDGYRVMAVVGKGECNFISRGGNPIPVPDLQEAVAKKIKGEKIIDGELVVLDKKGHSDFGALQAALKGDTKGISFIAFDLLYRNGEDLRSLSLEDRREALNDIFPKRNSQMRFSEAFDSEDLFAAACKLGLEGIISKRRASPYRAGRYDDWRKTKCTGNEDFYVGGFTLYANSRNAVGSLATGQISNGKLIYTGRVGTGFDDKTRVELYKLLEPLKADQPPFTVTDPKDRRDAIWVEPKVQVKVKFLKKTRRGIIRQARFAGVIEMASEPKPKQQTQFTVSHGDRVVDKKSGSTKQQVADYYQAILERLYPHLEDRPISVIRCPAGVDGESFFQRHLKNSIDGVKDIPVDDEEYMGLAAQEGILGLVQFGGIEFHPWGSRSKDINLPDRLIFDLDPGPKVDWKRVREAAQLVRKLVADVGLKPFLKVSGGKGLHVVCAIKPELDWDQVKAFARTLAESMEKDHPDDFVSKMSKSIRDTKIFVDYLRNDHTSTAVAPYSLRARPGLPAAWPIEWDQLQDFDSADAISISNYKIWLETPDAWKDLADSAVSLKKILRM
jgi:bifunctional non-homologous end joining protein LigD